MITAHDLGRGRLVVGVPDGRPQRVLRVDAQGMPSALIGRLLVGSYITGQDQVIVTAPGGLTADQRAGVREVVDRLLGMSVVNDTPSGIEIQNFVDPTKYALPRLLHRVAGVLRVELELCQHSLAARDAAGLERLASLEEEVDQFYLLMARQLLLSSDDPRIARDIDVASPHYQIGYRLVAKVLEMTGDLVFAMGNDLRQNLDAFERTSPSVAHELGLRIRWLHDLLELTMEGFTSLSVTVANETLDRIADCLPRTTSLGQLVARSLDDHRLAVAAQRIVCNLSMAMEMLIIVNEVTINRRVEPDRSATSDTRVAMDGRAAAPPPRPGGAR